MFYSLFVCVRSCACVYVVVCLGVFVCAFAYVCDPPCGSACVSCSVNVIMSVYPGLCIVERLCVCMCRVLIVCVCLLGCVFV